jgi:hypothetical protein
MKRLCERGSMSSREEDAALKKFDIGVGEILEKGAKEVLLILSGREVPLKLAY